MFSLRDYEAAFGSIGTEQIGSDVTEEQLHKRVSMANDDGTVIPEKDSIYFKVPKGALI